MRLEYLRYAEVAPHPGLKEIVSHYRIKSAKLYEPFMFPDYSPIFQGLIFNIDPLEDIILTKKEDINLRHKVYFVGQATSPSVLTSSSLNFNIIAVNFTSTGVFQLTGIDMNDITDQIIDAEMIFGKEISELYERVVAVGSLKQAVSIIDNFLCIKARNKKKQNKPCILMSLSVLKEKAGMVNVKMLQRTTNTSPKTLERSFKTEIGMTPKMYQRLLRFNQAKSYIEENGCTEWWEIVVRFGFYDHSHLISEFRFFSGKTPVQYLDMGNFGL